jgi:hypothetical protein
MCRTSNLQHRSMWLPVAGILLLACPALAIDIQVTYGDGFSDATFGAARTAAFEAAIQVWEAELQGSVVVHVDAEFVVKAGGPTWAVLGSAGPKTVHRDFTGAPLSSTWYVQALANQHYGSDLDGAQADIVSSFNSAVDGDIILGTTHWYYGTDGNPPGNDIDFFTTVLHELGHGLGFLDLIDPATGAWASGYPTAYSRNLTHSGVGAFTALNDAQRKTALTSGNVWWTGTNVIAEMSGNVKMYAPSPYEEGSSISHWDDIANSSPDLLMEPFDTGPIHEVDLTREAFMDIGWSVNAEAPGEIDIAASQALLVSAQSEWIFAAHWNSATSTFQFLGDWRLGGSSAEIVWYPVPDDQTCSVWIYSSTAGGYVKAFQYVLYASP